MWKLNHFQDQVTDSAVLDWYEVLNEQGETILATQDYNLAALVAQAPELKDLLNLSLDLLESEGTFLRFISQVRVAMNPQARICFGNGDGEICPWTFCPQHLDNEPAKSGRGCPNHSWEEEQDWW